MLSLLSNQLSELGPEISVAFHELEGEILSLLQGYLSPQQPVRIQRAIVESLRGLCQDTNNNCSGNDKADSVEWANTCVGRLGPSIAGLVHHFLTENDRPLDAQEVQVREVPNVSRFEYARHVHYIHYVPYA